MTKEMEKGRRVCKREGFVVGVGRGGAATHTKWKPIKFTHTQLVNCRESVGEGNRAI